MASARMRSITGARIQVIPPDERAEAYARMARANGRPVLRAVSGGQTFQVDPRWTDVAVGLYARIGCSGADALTGVVAIRERVSLAPVSSSPMGVSQSDRVFLIEALTVSDSMIDWRPPLRALLAAVATSLVATVHHDPAFRTLVAVRVAETDALAEQAVASIGGHLCSRVSERLVGEVWGAPTAELRFLDTRSARLAASLVLSHMDGVVTPSQPLVLNTEVSVCDRMLTVEFPRPLRHLRNELASIAGGFVDVGWRTPVMPNNDVKDEIRRAGRLSGT